ncbi:MAG: hypothetical protein JNJ52_01685 [Flavobacterium sp.]|nr:hypothetical protein [Flavobacterium sp.]
MKYFSKILLTALLIVLNSCSSDDDQTTTNPTEPTDDNFVPQFEMFINGQLSGYSFSQAYKTENTITFRNYSEEILSFQKTGQFGFCYINMSTGTPTITSVFKSFRGFSANYFNFNLDFIDEVNKKVKGTFSGYLYADPLNINSEKKFVSGSFFTKYEDVIPAVTQLGNKAKINGNDWASSNQYFSRETNNYNQVTQHDLSTDPYKIMIKYDLGTIAEGTYNFTNSNVSNKVQLAKFETQTTTFFDYNCSGTLTITDKSGSIISGFYSFTAIHPTSGESITVTDGVFKLIYRPF